MVVFQDAQLTPIVQITLNVKMMEIVWIHPVQNVDPMRIAKESITQAIVSVTQDTQLEIPTKAAQVSRLN